MINELWIGLIIVMIIVLLLAILIVYCGILFEEWMELRREENKIIETFAEMFYF